MSALLVKESMKSIAAKVGAALPRPVLQGVRRSYYRIRAVEPEICWLSQWVPPGKMAIDVGANRGDYALFLAKLADSLICFEPNSGLAADLEASLAGLPVTIENCALGNEEGEFVLHIPYIEGKELHGWASLNKEFAGESWKGHPILGSREETVQVKRLDDLGIENVGFIKIDVEGHEFLMLQGAEELIREQKPNLLVEIEQRHHQMPMQEIFAWLEAHGYRGKFLDDGVLRDIAEFDVAVHQKEPETDSYRNNFFFTCGEVPTSDGD